jgi:hypothetical protein
MIVQGSFSKTGGLRADFPAGREKFLKCDFLIMQKLKIIRNGKVKKIRNG